MLAPRTSHFQLSNIIAACIVAAGLVAAALIVSPRLLVPTAVRAKPLTVPPIPQAAAAEQFRTQVLASSNLHSFHSGGVTYTLTDVKVSQVIYSPVDDTFAIFYDWVWQRAIAEDVSIDRATRLTNDGYGHYFGDVRINDQAASTATITLK